LLHAGEQERNKIVPYLVCSSRGHQCVFVNDYTHLSTTNVW